ncbi:methylthioribose-1-phosphate isomerase [Sideroxyarcus emersonii]|uniref:Methylthioribose-1-phosphate isomerase n=1 Tax=Sideroxyarcus emersonii TaxID=2764705 RepID=A0AAN1XAG4_9PROT|nr:S-methyl-5-thioribose-1-phosphate isomerase [Sideroxyarcus emersonii]BCK87498.1 methylthioribose-1-phosphate isomerase [Sideroxyarcus emersonii]
MKVETLRWFNNRLEMIDQRILPAAFEYLSYYTAHSVAEGIRSMVVRGAPAIGVAAAYGVALEALRLSNATPSLTPALSPERRGSDAAEFNKGMEEGFKVLAASRPTAVNLFWALQRMRKVWESVATQTPPRIAQRLLAEAHEILAEDIRINKAMGAHGAALLKDGARVLTHCNAGALATAGWGTALGVFRSAVEAGKKISVIADETRPFLQGARLTAWEMVQENIPVTLITDNMAGHLMAQGEVDAVVVGTDRVAANGDVANKIGTYMVAVLARRHNIPFYVACPLSTIDLSIATGKDIPIEERSEDEVKGFRDCRWAAEGVKIRNPAFDVTPAELVTGLITEKGVILQPDAQGIRKLMQV